MRSIRFVMPVESVSGKFAKKSQRAGGGTKDQPGIVADVPLFIAHRRNNEFGYRLYYSMKNRRGEVSQSALATAARNRFRGIVTRVRTVYATAQTLNQYKEQYRNQSRQITLRKFIWDTEAALYDAEQNG